jgi:putative transposase
VEEAVVILERACGTRRACTLLGVPRSSIFRRRQPPRPPCAALPRTSHRKLTPEEHEQLVATVHQERFVDLSIREIYATLLDEGIYLCSIATMYRVFRDLGETRERRRIASHPARVKPELIATAPNQVLSWDITKLAGPQKWVWFHLYVAIDIFSRFVVGWRLEPNEDGALAEELFATIIAERRIDPTTLTVHADNGPAMIAKTLNELFIDLNITRSHSRPRVSNDNPYSEAQFKTLKYGPTYPERFASLEEARAWCERFFRWYNEEHHHVGIGLLTPALVYEGRGEEQRNHRRSTLHAAQALHPERFVRGLPEPLRLPITVAINPPESKPAESQRSA